MARRRRPAGAGIFPILRKRNLSSGDLIADRRAAYARALADAGDHAAAELMEQALELVPNWAGGWSLLGDHRERAGAIGAAIAAWRILAQLDTEGVRGGVELGAHGIGQVEASTDRAFVSALFDDYADRFGNSCCRSCAMPFRNCLPGSLSRSSNFVGWSRLLTLSILAAAPAYGRTLARPGVLSRGWTYPST